MTTLARQRCFHHPGREAVSQCRRCARFYCRECVTEHDGRLMCAACIAAAAAEIAKPRQPITQWLLPAGAAAGIVLAWLFFHYFGVVLAKIPAAWHEGGGK